MSEHPISDLLGEAAFRSALRLNTEPLWADMPEGREKEMWRQRGMTRWGDGSTEYGQPGPVDDAAAVEDGLLTHREIEINKAVLIERMACAAIADQWARETSTIATVGLLIRARTKPQEGGK